MFRLVFLLFSLFFVVQSCTSPISKKISFSTEKNSYEITPPNERTTMCKVSITGYSQSDLKLFLSGNNPICLKKGKIEFWRNYEWYNETKMITLAKIDNKSSTIELEVEFEFSSSYFGQNKSAGAMNCH